MNEIIMTTVYFLAFSILCLGIGHSVLLWLKWQSPLAMHTSIAYIVGFAVAAYTLILLALVRQFNLTSVTIIAAVYAVCFGRAGLKAAYHFLQEIVRFIQYVWSNNRWTIISFSALLVFLLVNYLGSFGPPTARDAISYHLPQANTIVATGSLDFINDPKAFYTNLPLLMEVMYAFGIMVNGYSLAHVLHYSLLVAFTLFIIGWLNKYFGKSTALWAGVSLYLLNQVVATATSALVDTAFMVLEIISVCLVIDWLYERRNATLMISGVTIGLALSIKYSPLFTAALLLALIIVASIIKYRTAWKRVISNGLRFFIPALIVGGFWYAKNFILYGNPTYPLLFGHEGYGEAEYASLVAAIQDFVVPRTVLNYVLIPVTFYLAWMKSDYPLLSLSYNPQYLVVLFSLVTLPWLMAIKKYRLLVSILLGYMAAFSLYWFFVATHQERFLDTATIVLILLAVIAITQLKRYWKIVPIMLLVVATVGIAVRFDIRHYLFHVVDASVAQRWLRKNEIYYLIGRIDKATYLESHFGCGVVALNYLDANDPQANVLDNWTKWHDHQFKFYDSRARFYPLLENVPQEDVQTFITNNAIRYIYIDTDAKNDFTTSSDPFYAEHYRSRASQEEALLATAALVFEYDSCQLYRLEY